MFLFVRKRCSACPFTLGYCVESIELSKNESTIKRTLSFSPFILPYFSDVVNTKNLFCQGRLKLREHNATPERF